MKLRSLSVLVLLISFSVLKSARADWKIYVYDEFSEQVSVQTEQLNSMLEQGDTLAIAVAKDILISTSDESSNLWARLNLVAVLNYFEQYEQSEDQLRIVQDAILGKDLGELRGFYLLHLGMVSHLKAHYSVADSIYRQLGSDRYFSNERAKALLAKDQAHNLRYLGDHETSQIKWYEALNRFERSQDSVGIVQCLQGIGIIKFLERDMESCKTYFDLALSFWQRRKNDKEVALAYNHLGLWYSGNKQYNKSIEYCTTSYQIRQRNNDIRGEGESLNNLARAYAGLENWDQALKYFQLGLQKLILGKDSREVANLQFNIGQILSKQGNLDEAETYLLRGIERAIELKQANAQKRGFIYLSIHYETVGELDKALQYQKRLGSLKDSLLRADKSRALEELEVRYNSEKKQQEIELLQRDKKISANRWLTLALGLIAVIIIAVLIIDGQRRRMAQDSQLHQTKNDLVEAELKNTKLELSYNQNKLAVYMNNLLKKNDMVQDLEERLRSFNEGKNNDIPEAKKLFNELANSRILTEEDWHQFRDLFNQAHEGFIPKLLDKYPDLTAAEQRLFLLMRLELPTKEIAMILGVSPESVKKGRYRLKRKLGLKDPNSLMNFILEFG